MPEDKEYSFEKTLGIITAWDEFTFDEGSNVAKDKNPTPKSRTEFTVDDVLVLIRRLKNFIDPKNVDRIERFVSKHIADKNNPHEVTIEQLVSSVMNEVYKDWLAYKNRTEYDNRYTEDELKELLSTEQFLKSLYQQVLIANVNTALEGKSVNEVTSVYDVAQMLKQHNEDLNAHSNLMEYLFPGAVHTYNPTLALIADTGMSEEFIITRNGNLTYMGPDGHIHTAGNNELPVDWSTGRPAFPIFGATSNNCTHGSVLTNGAFGKTNVTVTNATNIVNILNSGNPFKVTCVQTNTVVNHKLTYTIPSSVHNGKKTICISIFAQQGTLDHIGLNVHSGVANEYNCVHYNISKREMYTNSEISDNIFGAINDTPTGWVRLTYTCPAISVSGNIYVDIHLLDILDGDLTFKGDATQYLYLNGMQIEFDTDVPSPYKSTTGSIVTENATTIYLPINNITNWYNRYQGGVVVEVSNIEPYGALNTPRYVFDFCNANATSRWSMFYPAVHNGRMSVNCINPNSIIAYNAIYDKNTEKTVKYGIGFSNANRRQPTTGDTSNLDTTHAIYSIGSTISTDIKTTVISDKNGDMNPDVTRLFIGCQGNAAMHLNGYLYQFIYYPTMVTENHLRFFIKG